MTTPPKKPRRYRRALAAYIAAVIGLVTVFAYGQSATAVPTTAAPSYSAAQLADAIMFGQGPAAPRLVGANRPSAQMTTQMSAVQSDVHRYLAANPSFSASFARRIQSGDRLTVSAALSDLGTLAKSSMQREMSAQQYSRTLANAKTALSSLGKTNARAVTPDSGVVNYTQTINYYYYYAAAAAYGAVAVIILIFLICPPCATPTGVSGSTQVATDRFVNAVAQGLVRT